MLFNFFLFLSCFILLPLSTSKNLYNESLSKNLWTLCSISYCSPEYIEKSHEIPDFSNISLTEIKIFGSIDDANLAFSGFNDNFNIIFVAFRGTNRNFKNWMQNLNVYQMSYGKCRNCKVHSGFNDAYQRVGSDRILEELKSLKKKYPSAKLAVTGHSLGAAMATIALPDICKEFSSVDYFYTFGSPRVGDQNFADLIMNSSCVTNLFRVTHKSDPIVQLPFKTWLPFSGFGFAHLFPEVFYQEKEGVMCERESMEQCSFGMSKWNSLDDHMNNFGIAVCDK